MSDCCGTSNVKRVGKRYGGQERWCKIPTGRLFKAEQKFLACLVSMNDSRYQEIGNVLAYLRNCGEQSSSAERVQSIHEVAERVYANPQKQNTHSTTSGFD
jgi:hypothetical protein